MSDPTFTTGPWKLETESRSADGSDLLVTTPDGAWNIADCRDHSGLGVDSVEQAEANARLVAAAPEMFEALREARKWLPMHKHMQAAVDLMDRIDAVLAKAVQP